MGDRGSGRSFTAPVRAVGDGYVVTLDREERALLVRLLDELSALLTSDADEHQPLLSKLFPPAYADDEEKEVEYQRLMRDDLVASRLAAINVMREALRPGAGANAGASAGAGAGDGEDLESGPLDEAATIAFLQSVNAVRLVLGSMLDITDDDDADAAEEGESSEHQLYVFLSWLLEWTVQALSGTG
jgi:hypothetical protein